MPLYGSEVTEDGSILMKAGKYRFKAFALSAVTRSPEAM